MACLRPVHQTVCVDALVTVTPHVAIVGDIVTTCINNAIIGGCPGDLQESCVFHVGQTICVSIPLEFSANADAVGDGILCGQADLGDCSSIVESCTFSAGYYQTHRDEVTTLLAAAGGSITLGTGGGLSYTVTTVDEAIAVLNLDTPAPPAPNTNPHGPQYQQLYRQLLAANLNVLNGATCPFVFDAINNANTFLNTSSGQGKNGAPAVQTPLEQFNTGEAPGCPTECPET